MLFLVIELLMNFFISSAFLNDLMFLKYSKLNSDSYFLLFFEFIIEIKTEFNFVVNSFYIV